MGEAQRIANYCWKEMSLSRPGRGSPSPQYLRHVHCLRFLTAAFHGRTGALADFHVELVDHIRNSIELDDSLLFKNLSVEAVGLLPAAEIQEVAIMALSLDNEWISENTLNACRYIAGLSTALLGRLAYYLSSLPATRVLARYVEIRFSLSLSPAMAPLGKFWRARLGDVVVYSLALATMSVCMPWIFCLASDYTGLLGWCAPPLSYRPQENL